MIRNRIKKRIEQRRSNKTANNANDAESDDEFDHIDKSMIDDNTPTPTNKNEQNQVNKLTESSVDQSNNDQEINENFNYLTDVCKDKKFNKRDLSIILKVLKLELQPLIYLLFFIKGILLWTNTFFTFIIFILLLYFAYVNVVKYLFGLCFLMVSLLMFSMKTNRETTIFILAIIVGFVTPIDLNDETDEKDGSDKTNESKDKDLKRWQVFQRAKRVKRTIQKKFMQLGEFEYLLYELSIQIGKLRAIYFYKNETFGKGVCIMNVVIGLFCIILPLRVNYAIMVVIVFCLKPLLSYVKKIRGKEKSGQFKKKMKNAFDKIEPDIPNIEFNDKEQ